LDGDGSYERFADYSQWDVWQTERRKAKNRAAAPAKSANSGQSKKKKLSYVENRDLETIQDRVEEAENLLTSRQALLEDTAVVTDPKRLAETYKQIEEAQESVDSLYMRWSELEAKLK
jgi:ATP-binding cassette subfamily F protein uup